MEEASFVLVVDCVEGEERRAPSTASRWTNSNGRASRRKPATSRQLLASLGVLEMLGGRPPAVLLAMQVGEREPRPDLSPAVATALPSLVERLVAELAENRVAVAPRV